MHCSSSHSSHEKLSLLGSGCHLAWSMLPAPCPTPPSSCLPLAPDFLHAALESPAERMAHPLEVLGHSSSTALHFNSIYLAPKPCILVWGTILEQPWRSQQVPVPWREDTAKPGVSHFFVLDSLKWTMIISKIAAKKKKKNLYEKDYYDQNKGSKLHLFGNRSHMLSLRRGGGSARSIEIFFFKAENMMYQMNLNWFCFSSPRPPPSFCSECLRQRAPALPERRDVPQQRALPVPSRVHGHPVREAAVRGGGQLRPRLRPGRAPARLPRAAVAAVAAGRSAGDSRPPGHLGGAPSRQTGRALGKQTQPQHLLLT